MSDQARAKPLIIAATTDLFIQSRLKELAALLDQEILFNVNPQDLVDLAWSHPRCFVILDLQSPEYEANSVARTLKQNNPFQRILGYYPHVRKDLETSAKSAGVDYVVPNSNFLKVARDLLEGRQGQP